MNTCNGKEESVGRINRYNYQSRRPDTHEQN